MWKSWSPLFFVSSACVALSLLHCCYLDVYHIFYICYYFQNFVEPQTFRGILMCYNKLCTWMILYRIIWTETSLSASGISVGTRPSNLLPEFLPRTSLSKWGVSVGFRIFRFHCIVCRFAWYPCYSSFMLPYHIISLILRCVFCYSCLPACLSAYLPPYYLPTYLPTYSRSNSTKSPASGAGNLSDPSLMSQVGIVREVMCA
jgi:hypothetical protein